MNCKSFIIVILVGVVAKRNKKNELLGIVGGWTEDVSFNPWYASILHYNIDSNESNSFYFCGGSIVLTYVVLTAAHCINEEQLNSTFVRVGSNNLKNGGQIFRVKAVKKHPKYNETLKLREHIDYDIGIIWLEENLEFNKKIQPIALPDFQTSIVLDSEGKVCGFGKLSFNGTYPFLLQCIYLDVFINDICARYYFPQNDVNITIHNIICAGDNVENICFGDSGSGLIINNILFGVLSQTIFCEIYSAPSAFTSVVVLREWIQNGSYSPSSYLDIINEITVNNEILL